eukprot:3407123-Amphidinium_carterae.1
MLSCCEPLEVVKEKGSVLIWIVHRTSKAQRSVSLSLDSLTENVGQAHGGFGEFSLRLKVGTHRALPTRA